MKSSSLKQRETKNMRAGENFAQPRPFVELASIVRAWFRLGVLRWTLALPGRSKNCKLEKGIPGGFARTLQCFLAVRGVLKNPKNPL